MTNTIWCVKLFKKYLKPSTLKLPKNTNSARKLSSVNWDNL